MRVYSQLCAPGSLLVLLGDPFEVPGLNLAQPHTCPNPCALQATVTVHFSNMTDLVMPKLLHALFSFAFVEFQNGFMISLQD